MLNVNEILNTHEILNQHLKSFSERDLNGVLADYSSDAVMFLPGGSVEGSRCDQAVLRGPYFGVCKAWCVVFDERTKHRRRHAYIQVER